MQPIHDKPTKHPPSKGLGWFLLVLTAGIVYLLRPDGSTADTASQTPQQRDGGTAAERQAMTDYCTPMIIKKLGALPGIATTEITAPTVSYMGQRDGGNVYLQEAVYKKGDKNASWRCHRFNSAKLGWQDIEVSMQSF